MAKVTLTWSGDELRLQDYEGAGNVIRLEGQPVARLAHLSLHRVDLEFAQACLAVIEAAPLDQWLTPAIEAAWRSALLHYCKCFAPPQGGTGRSQLSATKILGREVDQRMKDHRLMVDLRNKHLVHDEGTHNWCSVAAVIAPVGTAPKVLGLKVAAVDSVSLDHLTVPTLRELVTAVHAWTVAEFDRMASELAATIASTYPHSELLAKESLGVAYSGKAGR
jgi:hypothetical protein